jgi:hypothetical protein
MTKDECPLDRLEKAIADKRKMLDLLRETAERAQRAAEIAEAELRAMEAAAQLRPAAAGEASSQRGRQPGAISKEWREVLRVLYMLAEGRSYEGIAELAEKAGIEATLGSVRERVRRFVEAGFLARSPGGFVATPLAAERFLLSPQTELDVAS